MFISRTTTRDRSVIDMRITIVSPISPKGAAGRPAAVTAGIRSRIEGEMA